MNNSFSLLIRASLFFLTSCEQAKKPSVSIKEFTYLDKASVVLKDSSEFGDYAFYYETVLIEKPSYGPDSLSEQMQKYMCNAFVLKRLFSRTQDSLRITFWKYNQRTAYFINYAEEQSGGFEDHLLTDDYDDLLGVVSCAQDAKNSAQKACVSYIYQHLRMNPVDTFKITIRKSP